MKRGASVVAAQPGAKRQRAVVAAPGTAGPPDGGRTSMLSAACVSLSGHGREALGVAFSPDGLRLASCGSEGSVMLWDVYGRCANRDTVRHHRAAALDVCWRGDRVLTASADASAAAYDPAAGRVVRSLRWHDGIVNAVAADGGGRTAVTASDDGRVALWDLRARRPAAWLELGLPVVAVACAASGARVLYAGGAAGEIGAYDARALRGGAYGPLYSLGGHDATVTGLALSPDGESLLSAAADGVRRWDVRPFCAGPRALGRHEGSVRDAQCDAVRVAWACDGASVAAGSSEPVVCVWRVADKGAAPAHRLPGHRGAVVGVAFHPTERAVVASAGTGGRVLLGEVPA